MKKLSELTLDDLSKLKLRLHVQVYGASHSPASLNASCRICLKKFRFWTEEKIATCARFRVSRGLKPMERDELVQRLSLGERTKVGQVWLLDGHPLVIVSHPTVDVDRYNRRIVQMGCTVWMLE